MFHVEGVTGLATVSIYADGSDTPIGTAVVSGLPLRWTLPPQSPVTDGPHTFTVKQAYAYDAPTVGNRSIPAGNLYSNASTDTVSFSVDAPPTAQAKLSDVTIDPSSASFVVTYSNPGDAIAISTIDSNEFL